MTDQPASPSASTPREWWIAKSEGFDSYYEDVEGPDTGTNNDGVNRVHVIEKSVYDAVEYAWKMRERDCAGLRAQLADANARAEKWERNFEELNSANIADVLKIERLTAELSEAKAEAIAYLALISGMDETMDELKAERDAYALAMAHALRHGIYANKQAVKDELEKILKDVKR
jgi:hypothetical protein